MQITPARPQIVYIVDDDDGIREGLSLLMETVDLPARAYASANEFLDNFDSETGGCLILDIRMPRVSGLDLQKIMQTQNITLPIIFITGHGDIPMAVEAMRQGALDFIRKPFREQDLLDAINHAFEVDAGINKHQRERATVLNKLAKLSDRERQIFERVSKGDMNKVIAYDLGISERTVEVHRAQVMKKLEVNTLPALVRCKLIEEISDVH